MVGGYILLNGEALAQIQSDDYDNPTEISKEDFYKIFNAIKSGKEIKVGIGSVVYPVLAITVGEDDGTLTFAITDGELNVSIITFSVFYTMDDTDPDNVVYNYFGIFKQSSVGGGEPVFLEFTKEEVDPGEYAYVIKVTDATAAVAAGAFMAKVTDDSGYLQFLPIVRFNSTTLWLYGIKFAGTIGTSTALLKATKVGDYFQFS